jgi:hypothetical protein
MWTKLMSSKYSAQKNRGLDVSRIRKWDSKLERDAQSQARIAVVMAASLVFSGLEIAQVAPIYFQHIVPKDTRTVGRVER